jgi:hypothetical protein
MKCLKIGKFDFRLFGLSAQLTQPRAESGEQVENAERGEIE